MGNTYCHPDAPTKEDSLMWSLAEDYNAVEDWGGGRVYIRLLTEDDCRVALKSARARFVQWDFSLIHCELTSEWTHSDWT